MDFEKSSGSNDPQAKDDKDYQAEVLLSANESHFPKASNSLEYV